MKAFTQRILALLCVLAMLFSLAACSGKKTKNGGSSGEEGLVLPYSSDDATDPYSATSETNLLLTPLVYQGLFTVNRDTSVSNVLAQSVTVQDKTITVKLKSAKFSDGTALTSDDVVHSFHRALQCERYKAVFSDFEDVEKKDTSVVRFILKTKNIFAQKLLDFPIVSQKDNRVGSGMYKFSETEEHTVFLEYNKYYDGSKPHITAISLVECKDYTNAPKLFNNGKIDFLFDRLYDGNVRSSAINSQKAKLNNFLFLGLNSRRGVLKDKAFRSAISLAINQTDLCEQALQGYALPTATPFDPEWSEIGSVVANSVLGKSAEAKQAFLDAGCAYDKMDINLLKDNQPVSLSIIVNSANNMKIALAEMIKAQLVGFGVSIEIKKMPLDEYNIAIVNGNFDMYIGEVKISNDFNLNCFFTDDGGAHFGIQNDVMQKSYLLYRGGNASLQDFVSDFSEQNPFIPIGYKCADACFNASLTVNETIFENNIYCGIEEWTK